MIAARPALAGLLALNCVFFVLYGPVEVALPLYVVDTLGGAAGLLGLFWAVFGIGAVAGSLAAGVLRRLPLWPTVFASVIGWGAALVGPLSPIWAPQTPCSPRAQRPFFSA